METDTISSTYETKTTKNFSLDDLTRNYVNSTSVLIQADNLSRNDLNSNEIKTYENSVVLEKSEKFIQIESAYSESNSNSVNTVSDIYTQTKFNFFKKFF